MKHKIFEFAIIGHPTEKEANAGKTTEFIVQPDKVLAPDLATANILASRQIPDKWLTKLDRVEIAVRPF